MRYQLAGIEVDTVNRLVTKADHLISVEPQVFNLLVYFCERPQETIELKALSQRFYYEKKVPPALIADIAKLHYLLEEEPSAPKLLTCFGYQQYKLTEKPIERATVGLNFNEPLTQITKPLEAQNAGVYQTKANTKSKHNFSLWVLSLIAIASICVSVFYWQKNNQPNKQHLLSKQQDPVISLLGASYSPSFSNASSSFVFLHKPNNQSNAQVYLGYIDSTPVKPLTDDNYFYMDAIFANNQIYATRFNNLTERLCDIVKISLSGKQVTKVQSCATKAVTKLDYSVIDNTLLYNYRETNEQPYSIVGLSLASGEIKSITTTSANKLSYGDYLFSLHQESQQLAVMEHLTDGSSLLKVLDLDDMTNVVLQRFHSPSGISWLDDDEIMISDDSGIVLFDISNQQKRQLDNNSNVTQLTSTNEESTIAYVERAYQVNIHQYELAGQNLTEHQSVTKSRAMNYKPVFANTSSSILFLAKNGAKESLFIKNNQGLVFDIGVPEPISFYTNFVWSTDDNAILASINGKLFRKVLNQKHWVRLYPELDSIHHITYLNDSNFAFSSNHTGSWQLWQGSITQQQPFQLTVNGGYSSQLDSTNNHLYFTKNHIDGLFMIDLERNLEQKVDASFPLNLWAHWQIRNESLYVQKHKTIEKIALSSLAIIDLYDLSNVSTNNFSVSRNEHLLVIDQIENANTNIWLAEVAIQ